MRRNTVLIVLVCLGLLMWSFWPSVPLGPVDAPALEKLVRTNFTQNLLHPEDAIWVFDQVGHYRFGGDVLCGTVKYRDSTYHYGQPWRFYAVIQEGKVVDGGIAGTDFTDPTHSFLNTMNAACRSVITR